MITIVKFAYIFPINTAFYPFFEDKKYEDLEAILGSYQQTDEFSLIIKDLNLILEHNKNTPILDKLGYRSEGYGSIDYDDFEPNAPYVSLEEPSGNIFVRCHLATTTVYSNFISRELSLSTQIIKSILENWLNFLENKDAKNLSFYETILEGIDKRLMWLNLQPADMLGKQQTEKDLLAAHKNFTAEKNQKFPIQKKVVPVINQLTEKIQRLKEKQKNGVLLLREQVQLDYLQKINAANTTTALNSLIAELQALTNIDNDTRKYLIRQADTKIAGL